MTKKQKVTLVAIFIAVLTVIGIVAAVLNHRDTQEGMKQFKVEVISERDGYSETTDCESDKEFLGEFLRELEGCEWQDSEFGLYITGFNGMKEDIDNQYWWSVNVNGESSMVGVDEVPLADGDVYTFELKQGWD